MMKFLRRKSEKRTKRGDTLIEVAFAIAVFSLVSVISIQIMDRDLAAIQGTLESEMARNEIDAQAEALRFIQNSYLSERELAQNERQYMKLWLKLSRGNSTILENGGNGLANEPANVSQYSALQCEKYHDSTATRAKTGAHHSIYEDRAFVINTRKINPNNVDATIVQSNVNNVPQTKLFTKAELYPRVLFTKGSDPAMTTNDEVVLSEIFPTEADKPTESAQKQQVYDKVVRAEGIWVIAAKQSSEAAKGGTPEFYDFHIRTCWFAPGHDLPSTIATTIRLYNPEYIEDQR
jgi:hypothetical protein